MATNMSLTVKAIIGPTQTIYTVDGKELSGIGGIVYLTDLSGYARGHVIVGGTTDWQSYDASGARQVLIGDGTDIVSRVLEEADIPSEIARDTEVTAEIATHAADANAHHNQQHAINSTTDHTGVIGVPLRMGMHVEMDLGFKIGQGRLLGYNQT